MQQIESYSIPSPFTLFDALDEGVLIIDTAWRFLYVNSKAEKILSRPRQSLLGKNMWELFPEAVGTVSFEEVHRAVAEKQATRFETYYPALQTWLEGSCSPSNEGLIILLQDISKRKRQEALVQRQATLLDLTSEAIIVWPFQGPINYWNRGAELLYGFTLAQALGKIACDLLQTRPSEPFEVIYDKLLHTGEWRGELQHITKDGRLLVVESIIVLIMEDDGSRSMLEINRDITERKAQEEALRRSQERATRLIDANIIGVAIADMNGIFESNDAFLYMLGYTREDLDARRIDWMAMTPPEFLPRDLEALEELKARGVCTPFEKEYFHRDGSRVPILIGAAVLEHNPLQWVCFILDMTESKELERRKDDFICIATHELKTPITTLKGLTQLLHMELASQGMQKPVAMISSMNTQINRLVKLVDELLDVSKIQAGRLDYEEKPVDVDALVYETVELLQPISPTHILHVSGATQAIITGDKDRLSQVITNLVINAVKYSPQANSVDIMLSASQKKATIAVRDFGIGIPQAHQKHIFDRFYRVHDSREKTFKGLGLGLYVAFDIVRRHGGDLGVESKEDHGSTFTISLPLNWEDPSV